MRVALVSLLTAAACSTSATAPDAPYGEGLGDPQNPVPQQADQGPYAMVNSVDFTIEAIVPAQVELAIATLRAFSENPASALFDVAEQQGVPAVGLIRAALPDALENKLYGWINDAIAKAKVNGRPITEYAGDLAGLADLALTHFEIDSEMTIDGLDVTHTLTALDLSPTGLDLRVPIGGLAADILTQHPTIYVGEAGSISFGDQHFGLQYGEYAWQGLNAASTALFGANIHDVIANAVNCPALAQTISDKCVLGVCVGHATELKAICTGGIDGVVELAHQQFAKHRLDAFQFATGNARLVDDDGDGVGDKIVDGTWDASMNLGMGLRHTPATFLGTR